MVTPKSPFTGFPPGVGTHTNRLLHRGRLSDLRGKPRWPNVGLRCRSSGECRLRLIHDHSGSAYNGHFGCTCYHPLFCFNQFGDLERCALRPGNVHSADRWRDVLVPVVDRYKARAIRLYFRGDAAFASPEIYDYLEAEGVLYAIRLPANKLLQESIAHLLKRPVGRPPKEVRRYYASFSYQAGTWDKPLRCIPAVS